MNVACQHHTQRIKRILINCVMIVSSLTMSAAIVCWAWLGRQRHCVAVVMTRNVQYEALVTEDKIVLSRAHVPWWLRRGVEHQRGILGVPKERFDDDVGDLMLRGRPSSAWLWGGGGFYLRNRTHLYESRSGGQPHALNSWDVFLPYWLLIVVPLAVLMISWSVARRLVRRAQRLHDGQCID